IPMYARGGALIPMWPEAPASTDGYHPSVVELHLFVPDSDGIHRSLLQEDDGLTLAASQEARVRTSFEVGRAGDRLIIRATVEGDGYPEFPRESFHLTVHGARPSAARLDGRELRTIGDRFVLPNAGAGFVLELAIE